MADRVCIVGHRKRSVDRELLKKLWFDESLTIVQISVKLQCSSPTIYSVAKELGLPNRRCLMGRECFFPVTDPTPEEIAQRAAEQRALRGPGWVMK